MPGDRWLCNQVELVLDHRAPPIGEDAPKAIGGVRGPGVGRQRRVFVAGGNVLGLRACSWGGAVEDALLL